MIKVTIRGENIQVSEALSSLVNEKINKIGRHFNSDQEIKGQVGLKVYRNKDAKVEITLKINGLILRSEDISQDMYASINRAADKIERQIRKNKTKIAQKIRERTPSKQVWTSDFAESETEETSPVQVVRVKRFELKPMSVDEAILQMELLGHDFFIYFDDKEEETNLLYKRKDGDYGIIETRQ